MPNRRYHIFILSFSWLCVIAWLATPIWSATVSTDSKKPAAKSATTKSKSKTTASKSKKTTSSKTTAKSKPKTSTKSNAKATTGTQTVAIPSVASTTPKGSLAEYLSAQLGSKKFHRRVEWAGRSGEFTPKTGAPRVWKSVGRVGYLTIHHAAGIEPEHAAAMIRNIYAGHVSPNGPLDGAADVGYHFLVDRNGDVWEARDASKIGSHVGSEPNGLNNYGNIGICGLGEFMNSRPTKAMSESIANLCALLARYYQRPLTVRGHKDWKGINRFALRKQIDCPGQLQATVFEARQRIAALKFEKPAPTDKPKPVVAESKSEVPEKVVGAAN